MSYRGSLENLDGMPSSSKHSGKQYGSVSSKFNKSAPVRWVENLEQFFNTIDKGIDRVSQSAFFYQLKPYIPSIARFFIVATFYEDSFRILTQWAEQVYYLNKWKNLPYLFVCFFLIVVVIAMLTGSTLLMLRKYNTYATGILCGCILSQALVYGLFSGSSFVLRNFSVMGGLLIAFSDSIVKNKASLAMLPELSDKEDKNKGYILLTGRMLIVLMFITFTFSKSWLTVLLTIIFTVCFGIGYKTKVASTALLLILTFYNVSLNNYWFKDSSERDFLKYEFFQNLSIIGGLLLVTNTGAGELSVDSKKKIY